jgi:hypothetical protein
MPCVHIMCMFAKVCCMPVIRLSLRNLGTGATAAVADPGLAHACSTSTTSGRLMVWQTLCTSGCHTLCTSAFCKALLIHCHGCFVTAASVIKAGRVGELASLKNRPRTAVCTAYVYYALPVTAQGAAYSQSLAMSLSHLLGKHLQ